MLCQRGMLLIFRTIITETAFTEPAITADMDTAVIAAVQTLHTSMAEAVLDSVIQQDRTIQNHVTAITSRHTTVQTMNFRLL